MPSTCSITFLRIHTGHHLPELSGWKLSLMFNLPWVKKKKNHQKQQQQKKNNHSTGNGYHSVYTYLLKIIFQFICFEKSNSTKLQYSWMIVTKNNWQITIASVAHPPKSNHGEIFWYYKWESKTRYYQQEEWIIPQAVQCLTNTSIIIFKIIAIHDMDMRLEKEINI